MKMKSFNLRAVLLAVIAAAALMLTLGMSTQAYADTDYFVDITPAGLQYTTLPGQSIPVYATVYYDFDDEGGSIIDDTEFDFKWELDDDDAEFGKIVVNAEDPSRAVVKFKNRPEGVDQYEGFVHATVTVYMYGEEIASGDTYLDVSDNYYDMYPDVFPAYMGIGEKYTDVVCSVYHYDMEHPEGEVVKDVAFRWTQEYEGDFTIQETEKTRERTVFDFTRNNGNDAYLSLDAAWKEEVDGEIVIKEEHNDFWIENVAQDLNEWKVILPEEMNSYEYFIDEGESITRDWLKENINICYGADNEGLLDRDKDYDIEVYKYGGYDEEQGEIIWNKYDRDLTTDPKGSAPDINGEPAEGTATYKITAKAKDGSSYVGETDDFAGYVFMYSTKALTAYAPTFRFNPSYIEYMDEEPWSRIAVKTGTILDPTVKLNGEYLAEGVEYKVVYTGLNVEYQGEEFPEDPGYYEVHLEGIGDYYGTSFSQFIKVGKKSSMTASGKTIKVKLAKKKTKTTKKATFSKAKAFIVQENQGDVSFEKTSGSSKITVSSAGKITVKKGLKKGTYKIKVKVIEDETEEYFGSEKTVTVTVKVVK